MSNRLTFDPSIVPDARPGPDGGLRARNRAARTADLCRAALARCLADGLDTARIDAIAADAGLSKAAFYRYFKHKAAIVEALFAPLGDTALAALDRAVTAVDAAADAPAVRQAYLDLALSLLDLFAAEPGLVRLFLQERHGAPTDARRPVLDLDRRVVERAKDLTRVAQARGWVRAFDPDVSAVAVIGAVFELIWRRLPSAGRDTPDVDIATIEQLVDLVLYGVRTEQS